MKRALFFTAYDRPEYLERVLHMWNGVRGLDRWHIVARIEPGAHTTRIRSMFEAFFRLRDLTDVEVVVNPKKLGVLHHPWVGFTELFQRYDFVVRTEDDLLVSEDILEYFEWASEEYSDAAAVMTVHGFSLESEGNPADVQALPRFNPLVFGTWKKRWNVIIGPTWDHDYSTFNVRPGNQSGWDWNLNTRVYPQISGHGVYPVLSRVKNIGMHGTHSTPENHYDTPVFLETIDSCVYHEVPSP